MMSPIGTSQIVVFRLRLDRLACGFDSGADAVYDAFFFQDEFQRLDSSENVGFSADSHSSDPEYLAFEARLASGYNDAALSHTSTKLIVCDPFRHLHGGHGVRVAGVLVWLGE